MALMLPVPVMGALVLALWKDSSLCGGARMNLVLEVSPHEPRMGHLVKGQSLTRVVMPVRFPVDDLWPRHARV